MAEENKEDQVKDDEVKEGEEKPKKRKFLTNLRDKVQAGAVIAGNVIVPGSRMVTEKLISKGAKEDLNSKGGKALSTTADVVQGKGLVNLGLKGAGALASKVMAKDAKGKEETKEYSKGGSVRGHGCETKGKTKGRFR